MGTSLAYAELSCKIPSAGSTYTFAYHALGEVFGLLGACFLTFEYGLSGSAVARSWGDKVAYYMGEVGVFGCSNSESGGCFVNELWGTSINLGAGFICTLMVLVLLQGVELGRVALNILVCFKVALVLFVIAFGFSHFEKSNVSPFISDHTDETIGGINGILIGSTSAFFGYIGFDEVACLTMEAINPAKDVPAAIIGTIAIITVLYVLASLALVGMVPHSEIDVDEGFGSALGYVGATWAVHLVMLGQVLVVLPAVVFVGFLPQSRLLATVAGDGMLPHIFTWKDDHGNFRYGVILSGALMTMISVFTPFHALNDLISGGILLSFILTNTSLLVLRAHHENSAVICILLHLFTSAFLGALLSSQNVSWILVGITFVSELTLLAFLRNIMRWHAHPEESKTADHFEVPGVPFVPGLAISANWILLAQISVQGMVKIALFILSVVVIYVIFRFLERVNRHTLLEDSEEDSGDEEGENVTEIELTRQ